MRVAVQSPMPTFSGICRLGSPLSTTTNSEAAYRRMGLVFVCTSTNHDTVINRFDTPQDLIAPLVRRSPALAGRGISSP